jgi:uncharacterized protein
MPRLSSTTTSCPELSRPGQFRFHLKAANGEIIAASQGYETKASAEKGIESVKTNAPGAPVVDQTE